MRFACKIAVSIAGMLLAGCSVGPNYEPPAANVPESYGATTQPTSTTLDLRQWWTTFNDPALNSLIDRASNANLDLRLAALRIREARAQRGVANAGFYPTVDATG